jgi:hypothetical protein
MPGFLTRCEAVSGHQTADYIRSYLNKLEQPSSVSLAYFCSLAAVISEKLYEPVKSAVFPYPVYKG